MAANKKLGSAEHTIDMGVAPPTPHTQATPTNKRPGAEHTTGIGVRPPPAQHPWQHFPLGAEHTMEIGVRPPPQFGAEHTLT